MCDSKDDCVVQAKIQTDDLFIKLSTRNVPLTKADLRMARAALQKMNSISSDKGSDRK